MAWVSAISIFFVSLACDYATADSSTTIENTNENIPSYVQVTMLTASAAIVQWKPPKETNGEIVGYKIHYLLQSAQTEKTEPWQIKLVGNTTLATISDLIPNANYDFRVQVLTKQGPGELSSVIQANEKNDVQLQNVIANAVNSTTINVKWKTLTYGLPVQKRQIIVKEIIKTCDFPGEIMKFDIMNVDVNEYNITGLQPATEYSIQLAINSFQGEIKRSHIQFVSTHVDVPTISDMTIEVKQEEPYLIVQIQWSRPIRSYGPLLRYRLRYQDKGSHHDPHEIKIHPSSNHTTVPNLNHDTVYEFRLSAGNAVGWSQESVITFKMPEGVPTTPPKNITSVLIGLKDVAVHWDPPATSYCNGKIIHYGLEFGKNTDQIKDERNITDLQVTFSSLDDHTDYVVRVRAYTSKGPGPWSRFITTRTSGSPKNVKAMATSDHSVEVWWDTMAFSQDMSGCNVFYTKNSSEDLNMWHKQSGPLTNSVELSGLESNAEYTISVDMITKEGSGLPSEPITAQVTPTDVPINITAYNVTTQSMVLTWCPPKELNTSKYKISFSGIKEFYNGNGILQEVLLPTKISFVDLNTTELRINNLSPFANYLINITALINDEVYQPPARITVTTKMTAPKSIDKPMLFGSHKNGMISVSLYGVSEEYGIISHYFVVVVPDQMTRKKPDDFTTEELVSGEHDESGPYIAAKFERLAITRKFDLGDEGVYNGFVNKRLVHDAKYRIFIRAVVGTLQENLYTSSPYSDNFTTDINHDSCQLTGNG